MEIPISLLKDSINISTSIIDRYLKWRELKQDNFARLRLLYLECRKNLELLDTLNLDSGNKTIFTDDEDFKQIIPLLEIDILEMVFLTGKENTEYYKSLEEIVQFRYDDKKSNINEMKLIDSLIFLYVKISTLKKLSLLPIKGKGQKSIRFRYRLKNIKNNLHEVRIALKNTIEI